VVNSKGRISFIPGNNLKGQRSIVEISVYSPNGGLLKRITSDAAGPNSYSWDLKTVAGKRVNSSLYLYRYTFRNGQGREISRAGKIVVTDN
jgi:hypothetical protein